MAGQVGERYWEYEAVGWGWKSGFVSLWLKENKPMKDRMRRKAVTMCPLACPPNFFCSLPTHPAILTKRVCFSSLFSYI